MRLPPYLGRALVAGLICLISILVFRRYLPYVGSTLEPSQPPSVVLEMRNARFVGLNHKGKIWSLKAKKVEIGQNRYMTTLTGITQGKIFDAGKPALTVEAGKAVYNSLAGSMVMDEGILLTGPDSEKIIAKGADWNSTTSLLRSFGKVRYESPWGEALTDRLLVNTKTRELTMWNVNARFDVEAGPNAM